MAEDRGVHQIRTPSQKDSPRRKVPACLQCRDRKVRCSGKAPCTNCVRRAETCLFKDSDRQVLVSEKFLASLSRKARASRSSRASRSQADELDHDERQAPSPVVSRHGAHDQHDSARTPADSTTARNSVRHAAVGADETDHTMKNPLVGSPSHFLRDATGRKRFLGPSSTWAYSRHVTQLLTTHLTPGNPSTQCPEIVDGLAFPLDVAPTPVPEGHPDLATIPPMDYAMYLLNTVKFHIGQTYHLFDETIFIHNLRCLYKQGPPDAPPITRLWLCQYFIIIALGKALLHRGRTTTTHFGRDFFLRAMAYLPNAPSLTEDPVLAIEVCCAIALYLQSVDHRFHAYIQLGVALRIALGYGIHQDSTDPQPVYQHGDDRQRSAWWTLYILDRKFSYLMGTPTQVNEVAISATLPTQRYRPPEIVKALDIHVQLSRLIGRVVDTVYAVDGRLPVSFLKNMQYMLRELASLAETLAASIDLSFDVATPVNRLSGTLNLCYHQCIILATRPLFVHLLREHLSQRDATQNKPHREISSPIVALLQTSSDSAMKSIRILQALQAQDLLDAFLPFDLEYAFSAAFVLLLVEAVHPFPDIIDHDWLSTTLSLISNLAESGHVVASFRYQEIQRLHEMLQTVVSQPAADEMPVDESGGEQTAYDMQDSSSNALGSSLEMASIADLMSQYPILDMEAGFIDDEWLWEPTEHASQQ